MRLIAPHSVTILVVSGSSMMSLASVVDPLRAANRFARKPLFEWSIRSLDGAAVELSSGIRIDVDGQLDHQSGDALIVIAGFNHEQWTAARTPYMARLRDVSRRHNRTMAVEAGTWLLAKSGTIADHRVTTHWEDLEALAHSYPHLIVRRDRYTIDRTIWSCGGASPALDMMLHYVRTSGHPALALEVANAFIYDDSHSPSETQIMSATSRLHQIESRVARAITLMEDNLEEPLSIQSINAKLGVSAKTLELLFRTHLATTPKAFYLRIRLQAARRLVLDSNLKLTDIAVRTGFNSQTHFSRGFKRHFGVAPRQLRKQARA